MPTYSKQGGRAVEQAREIGIKLQLFGCDPWDVPEFREAAGSAANGVLFTVFDQYAGPKLHPRPACSRSRWRR
jgi:ABC-type branched-subunit amino acid transport system substrate-binding protein